MTGADRDADPGALPERRWDVTLSFAGAQRDYVEQVARALRARGMRCFYDADEQIDLWGRYLAEELPAIYGEQAAAVVVFMSAEYADRDWTRLERRAALGRAVKERREYVLPARFDDTPLPGLLSDLVAVDLRDRSPEQFAAMIAAKLAALDVTAPGSAGSPASAAGMSRPSGAVRPGEANQRRLGVHVAISVPGVPDEVPPEYVPRDTDAAGNGVRAKVTAAAERGGFVLLVGGSSVGKTRCAVEAVRALLPDWWLVHPAGPGEVVALAVAPTPRLVVWLDELQRYLDGEHGLTGGVVRALLDARHPAVIIGTLWPEWYNTYTTVPASGNAVDPHAREREVLKLANIVRIDEKFSPAEQGRARAAAARDARLQVALKAARYGLTQTLAAAPQLVARWENAKTTDPYAWAVLTAALDAARLGARAPLTADFLRAAAPSYCTPQQQAEAPADWFEQALAYATKKLNGAVAALTPAGTGMGRVAGYTAADYLIQHAGRERRYERMPASTWDALLLHLRAPDDAARLADSTRNRLLYRYAIPLYRHAASVGDEDAAWRLAGLLVECGDLDELRRLADAGDREAALRLAGVLAQRGDVDEAVQVLRTRADAGDPFAALQLADLLAQRGDLDEAEQILRGRASVGDEDAARRLAGVLAQRGDLDGLRGRADVGDPFAALQLADLLAQRGDLDEAEQVLRAVADAGDEDAARRLAGVLAQRGDIDEAEQVLRAVADVGDPFAASQLADLLAQRGDLDGLRGRADVGDSFAASQLADLLAQRGDLDGLRGRVDAGDGEAASRLPDLLIRQGRTEEAERLRRFGLNPDGSIAALGIVASASSADAGGPAWDGGSVPPAVAARPAETEADAAVSVHSDALDVLSYVLSWKLAAPRWQEIEKMLVAMDTALQANDLEALAEATIRLELAGPLRATRIGGTSVSAPPDAVRGRVVQLMLSLRGRRRAQEERDSGGAGR
jgi:predicted negative regulator of RcsB-dependent stress response